ncbi:MAG: hypothetical protein HY735_29195 [Verrucomicrobia bacterium]|nr:hypothetical protein [Verrucomicrobiota bacterium]
MSISIHENRLAVREFLGGARLLSSPDFFAGKDSRDRRSFAPPDLVAAAPRRAVSPPCSRQGVERSSRFGAVEPPQAASLRYGRLKICATNM